MNIEEFKNIPFEICNNYLINKQGIVINGKTGRTLKPYKEKGIYERITFFGKNKKTYKIYVSDLLWHTFGTKVREEYEQKLKQEKELLELQELEKELNNIQEVIK
jgi:hypothetical protein